MGRSATQNVQTPGAVAPQDDAATAEQPTDQAAVIAALQAQLKAQEVENARLRAASSAADSGLPQVVYEPETPHGKEAMRTSPTAHMTVGQVQAAIDAGEMAEPVTSYLCKDGYYSRRARSAG